jgi:hypothetical protein
VPRRFTIHLIAANAVLAAAIWLSTGTMAPYAAMSEFPMPVEPCHYLVNGDHWHFTAAWHLLAGDDQAFWVRSVVLRRLLFPLLSFPFVRLGGVLAGGILASALMQLAAVTAFALFVRGRVSERAAVAVVWLLATYPGITYWAGLPYSYAAIVPGSLVCAMLLYRLNDATTAREIATIALLLGILALGYDFLPFFGTAAVLLLIRKRRFAWTLVACALMVVPTLLVGIALELIGAPLLNVNTAGYLNVLRAYLRPGDFQQWLRNLAELPLVFLSNFVFGNLVFLPLLFAGFLRGMRLEWPDKALLAATIILFVFNNAAPPYDGWQLRGHWIARLYQPVLPALLMGIARASAVRWWRPAVVATVLLNASIAFGPVLLNPLAAHVYQRFYVHASADTLLVNLRRFGRRPLGVCRTTHEWDHVAGGIKTWQRPAYMWRPPAVRQSP